MESPAEGRSRWGLMKEKLKAVVWRKMYWHGLMCASNPFIIIAALVLLVLFVSVPAIPVLTGNASQAHVWTPRSTSSEPEWFDGGSITARILELRWEVADQHLVDTEVLKTTGFDVPRKLNTHRASFEASEITLQDLCLKSQDGECYLISPGTLWKDDLKSFELDVESSRVGAAVGDQPSFPAPFRPANRMNRDLVLSRATSTKPAHLSILLLLKPQGSALEVLFFDSLMSEFGGNSTLSEDPQDMNYIIYQTPTRKLAERNYLIVAYIVVFLYVCFSIGEFEFVKSKFGLGFGAIFIVFGSMTMSVGICKWLGLLPTLTAVEVVPFLVMAIGLDNMTTITKCVVQTSTDKAVRFRVAEGLGRASWPLVKSLVFMEFILITGVYSHIEALQEFCVIAAVGVLADFFLQVVFYVTVLSVDIRRMELSDLSNPTPARFFKSPSYPLSPDDAITDLETMVESQLKTEIIPMMSAGFFKSHEARLVVFNNIIVIASMILTVLLALVGGATIKPNLVLSQPIYKADWRGFLLFSSGHSVDKILSIMPPVTLPSKMLGITPTTNSDTAQRSMLSLLWRSNEDWSAWASELLPTPTSSVFAVVLLLLLCVIVCLVVNKARKFFFGHRQGMDAVAAFSLAHFDVKTLTGHQQDIECLIMADDERIISACLGGQVRVWDSVGESCIAALRGSSAKHDNTITATPWCLASHSALVAVGCGNGDVEVWDTDARACTTLRLPRLVEEDEPVVDFGGVTCLLFHDSILYSASANGNLESWTWEDVLTDEPLHSTELRRMNSTTSVGGTMYFKAPRQAGPAAAPAPIVLQKSASTISLTNEAPMSPPRGHRRASSLGGEAVSAFRQSPLLNMDSSPEGSVTNFQSDRRQRTSYLDNRHLSWTSGEGRGPDSPLMAARRAVEAARSSRTPDELESVSNVSFTGSANTFKRFRCLRSVHVHKAAIQSLQMLNSGFLLSASADRTLKLFKKDDLTCVTTLHGHTNTITCLEVADSKCVVTGSADRTVRVWNTETAECTHVLKGHEDSVLCVQVNRDYIVSSGEDDAIRVWLRKTGKCIRALSTSRSHLSFVLHPTSILVTASDGKLTAWDLVAGGERLRTISLKDSVVPTSIAPVAGSLSTNRLVLHGDDVICDLGRLIKVVTLPFPTDRHMKTT